MAGSGSALRRMFRLATDAQTSHLEDFSTEALALAVEVDPMPVIEVLMDRGLLPGEAIACTEPFTQYRIEHQGAGGRVDMVLRVTGTDGALTEVWFESKAHAPESGDQLALYRATIDAWAGQGVTRHLVVLAPKPISEEPGHVFIAWQDIADAAARRPNSKLWAELRQFLKEYRMTTDTMLPISDGEAASLPDAHRLLRKMRYLMTRVNAEARGQDSVWEDAAWVRDRDVRSKLVTDFRYGGRYRLKEGDRYAAQLVWGAEPWTDGLKFVVLVEADLKLTHVRAELRRLADGLVDWDQPEHRKRVLQKAERATSFGSDDDAVAWFLARLEELHSVGIIGLIPSLQAGGVARDEPVDDDTEPV